MRLGEHLDLRTTSSQNSVANPVKWHSVADPAKWHSTHYKGTTRLPFAKYIYVFEISATSPQNSVANPVSDTV